MRGLPVRAGAQVGVDAGGSDSLDGPRRLRRAVLEFRQRVRLVRRLNNDGCGLDDDDLEQLAWDKREEWEAAGYVPPAAGRRFHDTLDGLADGDLVFEEEQP